MLKFEEKNSTERQGKIDMIYPFSTTFFIVKTQWAISGNFRGSWLITRIARTVIKRKKVLWIHQVTYGLFISNSGGVSRVSTRYIPTTCTLGFRRFFFETKETLRMWRYLLPYCIPLYFLKKNLGVTILFWIYNHYELRLLSSLNITYFLIFSLSFFCGFL